MVTVSEPYIEQALLLGARRTLVSIVTRPRASEAADLPAIVVLNTGIIHRVGHHRMYVTMARMLAAAGRTVVRFDQAGLGDSPPRTDGLAPLAAGLADIKEVLDGLEAARHGSSFVLLGLCSGADQAVLYGHQDPRVVGIVIMDPTIPPTPRYYLYYVLRRMRNWHSWRSLLTGRSGLVGMFGSHIRSRLKRQEPSRVPTLQDLQFSSYLAQSYAATAARGMKILAAFTALSPRHAYVRQILDAFPEVSAQGSLQLQYFPESDHLFSAPSDRARLMRVIESWLGVHWAAR